MAIFVGAILAIAVGLFGTVVGLDRDRAFYSTITIIVASYYALFAVVGDSTDALILECVGILAFVAMAAAGFRTSLWLIAVALAAHGVFDFVHDELIANPGVPDWWPGFCGAFDVVAAMYLASLLLRRGGARAPAY